MPRPFVLVHGSWHGGWCWWKVAPLLRARGHDVYTPTLTGLGERGHLLTPEVGLETHIVDVAALFSFEDVRDAILVGHSYAGLVITGAAEHIAERIASLVYIDALIAEDGKCGFDLLPGERERREAAARESGDGWRIAPPDIRTFGVADELDAAFVRERLTPMPIAAHTQPLRLSRRAAARLPRSFIRCTRTGEFAPALARASQAAALQALERGWDVRDLDAPHDAMITSPRELADLLVAIAAR